jgi:hypothetical protein
MVPSEKCRPAKEMAWYCRIVGAKNLPHTTSFAFSVAWAKPQQLLRFLYQFSWSNYPSAPRPPRYFGVQTLLH